MLALHPAALDELEAATAWHEEERPGCGELLLSEVRAEITRAATMLNSGVSIEGFAATYNVRAFNLRRFRYRVIVALVAGSPLVVAVAHTSREPGYWRERLG